MKRFVALGFGWLAFAAAASADAPALPPAQFNKLLAVIRPEPTTEKWQQIPWQASLWEARQQAAQEGKPILLWEMDGHPLGCV